MQSSASSNGPHLQERKTSSEKEEGDVIVEEEKSGEKEKTTTTGDELPYIEHRVLPSDSLYSLALRVNHMRERERFGRERNILSPLLIQSISD